MLSLLILGIATPLLANDPVAQEDAALQADRLRADAQIDPVQAPSFQPSLSWISLGSGPAAYQTGFQVQAATTRADLREGRADLWDSGHVQRGNQPEVEYDGAPLESGRQAFWRVRLWDANGVVGPWSAIASFGAPLRSEDWRAEDWIGLDTLTGLESAEPPDFSRAQWVAPLENLQAAKPGKWTVGRVFELPTDARVQAARAWIQADDSFELALNGHALSGGGNWRVVEAVDLTEWIQPGSNALRVRVTNNGADPTALRLCLQITRTNGETVDVWTDDRWTLGTEADEGWLKTAPGETSVFTVAQDVAAGIWGDRVRLPGEQELTPPRYLRTDFASPGEVRRATLYLASLGFADAYLNGELVSSRFVSDWTHFEERVLSLAYDVTEHVRTGGNALGLVLSDGWFSGFIGWSGTADHWGSKPRAAAQLVLEYADGTRSVVRTGGEWRASTGPIQSADMLAGEVHDARILSADDFSEPGFDDRDWLAVNVGTTETKAPIQPSPGPAIDAFAEFKPVSVTEAADGTWIFDLGRNIAGVARLRVRGSAGQRIQLRFGERLNPDGTLYTANLRGAQAVDTYICRGNGLEVWEPRFTFHGFQYVEVTGLDEVPSADLITGIAIGSLTPDAGRFECSSAMLNQLASNVYWTQRSNFISVPTDCPQRDERLGWTGDAQVYVRTAGLWCDVQPFFDKWLIDLSHATSKDGNPPKVAPVLLGQSDGGPAWSDAATVCPWEIYRMYGDRGLLERQYPDMRAYVDFNTARAGEDRSAPKQFHCFGDWLNLNDGTPNAVIFMAYWAESTRLVAEAARVLGRLEEASRYDALRSEIIAAFHRDHVDATGRVDGDSQTAYVLALRHQLVTGERREQAIAHLLRRLEEADGHLSTGFVGTKDLMLVLDRIGRNDVAYRLALHEDYPSWGFAVRHGATSIWERWDGWTPDRGFQDPGMNSFAHYSFGAVYRWMVEVIGGIRLGEPGYASFEIAPQPGGGLTFADVAVDTVRGEVTSRWAIEGERFSLEVGVPANAHCTVRVPTERTNSIRVDGQEFGSAVLQLPPGQHRIDALL